MDQSLEQWRPVAGYEGLYEVSNAGRVKSLERLVSNVRGVYTRPAQLIKLHRNSGGYVTASLYINGNRKTYSVHFLVAQAFLRPCPGGYGNRIGDYTIDHINRIKSDNRVENLRWLSHCENSKLRNVPIGARCKSAKLTAEEVIRIRSDARTLKAIATDYNVSIAAVGHIKSGRNWRHV
jgi:hypothetical protein